jgi:hypothetical protein
MFVVIGLIFGGGVFALFPVFRRKGIIGVLYIFSSGACLIESGHKQYHQFMGGRHVCISVCDKKSISE